MISERYLLLVCALMLSAVEASALGSAGVGNEDISARSLGMGGTGTADGSDAAAAYLNPAGLAFQTGVPAAVGVTAIFPVIHRRAAGASTDSMIPSASVTPNLAAGFPVSGKLRGGLAVEAPYGGHNLYSDTGFARYLVTKSQLSMVDISPSLAYPLSDRLGAAVSLHYYSLFDLTSENKINETAINSVLMGSFAPSPDADASFKGDGSALGAGLALMFKPSDGQRVGAVWRSRAVVPVKGDLKIKNINGASAAVFGGTEYRTGASFNYPFPQNIQLGYACDVDEKLTLEADAAWYQWSALERIDTKYEEADPTRRAVLGVNSQGQSGPEPKNYRDTLNFAVGAAYRTSDRLTLRAGYARQPYLTPQENFHPESPDMTRNEFTVGAGLRVGKTTVDLAYMLSTEESRRINNKVGDSSLSSIDGKWTGTYHLMTLQATRKF